MRAKIGILTYHRAINYGAAFQTRATYDYLTNAYPNYDFELIDYRSKRVENQNRILTSIIYSKSLSTLVSRVVSMPLLLLRKVRFVRYLKSIKTSPKYADNINRIDGKYNLYIIGSDQLWNFDLNDGDINYLLPFVKDKSSVITLATSIGANRINPELIDVFYQNVSRFGHLSVREYTAKEYLLKDLHINSDVICDPVFLMDREKWINNASAEENKVFLYLFRKENLAKITTIISRDNINGYKSIKVAGGFSYKDFLNPNVITGLAYGPNEFISALSKSKYVFTDSFHCTALSLIFHKPFIVFLNGNQGADSRIVDLLEQVGLSNRIYENNNSMHENIDWKSVDLKLKELQDCGKLFIENALSNINDW